MAVFEDLVFNTLTEADVEPVTEIMKRAFDEDSMIHQGRVGGPPGYDDGSFVRKWGIESETESYTIYQNDKLVGCLILWINAEEHSGFLGTIFLDPSTRRQGLGQKVWRFAEASHPEITRWGTETPGWSRRNHNFYINKLGFHVVNIENPFDPHEISFQMEKRIPW